MANLKVYLTAETKQFKRSMRKADRIVAKASKNIKRYGMMAGAAFVGAGVASVKAFAVQEAAENALASAMASHGDAIDALMPKAKALASQIQRETKYGDEDVLGMMAQIRNLGVLPGKLEEATKGSIGLAKALQMDANTAARYTALAMQGEYTVLQRYVPALRTATSAAEKQTIVTDLMNQGYEQAQAETETLDGKFTQLQNAAGDVAESFGNVITEALDLDTATGGLTDRLLDFSQQTKRDSAMIAFEWQYMFVTIKTALKNTFDFVKIAVTNGAHLFKNFGEGLGIFASNMVDDFWGAFKWLSTNWKTVVTNMGSLSIESFGAIGKLLADVMLTPLHIVKDQVIDIFNAIKNRDLGSLIAATTPLDDIKQQFDRIKNDAQSVFDNLSSDLGLESFTLKGADGAFAKFFDPTQYADPIDAIAKNEADKIVKLNALEAALRKKMMDREHKEKKAMIKDEAVTGAEAMRKASAEFAGAATRGSTEAYSATIRNRKVDKAQEATAKNTEDTALAVRQLAEATALGTQLVAANF